MKKRLETRENQEQEKWKHIQRARTEERLQPSSEKEVWSGMRHRLEAEDSRAKRLTENMFSDGLDTQEGQQDSSSVHPSHTRCPPSSSGHSPRSSAEDSLLFMISTDDTSNTRGVKTQGLFVLYFYTFIQHWRNFCILYFYTTLSEECNDLIFIV